MRNALHKLTPGNNLAAVAEELREPERAREAAVQRASACWRNSTLPSRNWCAWAC